MIAAIPPFPAERATRSIAMTAQPVASAFDLDRAAADAGKAHGSDAVLLAHASRSSGRSVLDVSLEARRLSRGEGRLTVADYVRHGLHHADRFDEAARAAFLSDALHWPAAHACNDAKWLGAAEDKTLAAMILSSGGVPVPRDVAVFDTSARRFPTLRTVSDAIGLRDAVLAAHAGPGAFLKPLDGMISAGAFAVEEADREGVRPSNAARMPWEAFARDHLRGRSYLVQESLHPDPALAPWTRSVATVRTTTVATGAGFASPHALLKLPQGANVADNFWRPGNLACGIDVETGRIRRIARGGQMEIESLPDHPDRPGLTGFALPHWEALRDCVARVAEIFAPLAYHSTDIALTRDGPVVVEVNYGGSFDLVQVGCGHGFLGPETRALFAAKGALARPPARRGIGIFRRG